MSVEDTKPRDPTRRRFLELAGGTLLLIETPIWALRCSSAPVVTGAGGGEAVADDAWSGGAGRARYRIEGKAKVKGEKIYARDFRSKDLPGWPIEERLGFVLRATLADRPYLGVDLEVLPPELRPMQVIDAAAIETNHIADLYADTSPQDRQPGLLVKPGDVPVFVGQPLAILIFEDFWIYRKAHRLLQFNPSVIRYGSPETPASVETSYAPPTYLTRYAGEHGDLFSQVKDGRSDPYDPHPSPNDLKAVEWRARIRAELEASNWQRFSSISRTQKLDPMFMEPEAGIGWYDWDKETMHLLLGTQSTNGDIGDVVSLFREPDCPFVISTVDLISCYPGGGFGGRDTSTFPPLLMLAAAFADGPVRIAHDRFAQFQAGVKQLGAVIEQEIAVDSEGRFQALIANMRLQAGGKNNYSQFVAALAGFSASGGYRFPRAIVDATSQPTSGVVAGSMRGFGGPQVSFARETLVDEIAERLRQDPLDLRLKNVLARGDHTVTGAPLDQPLRYAEICRLAQNHDLWTSRATGKAARSDGQLRGVGFALSNEAFGTGSDGVMAAVEIDGEGRIAVITNCVDMGNGSATTLAICTAGHLGANASRIHMGEVSLFEALGMQRPVTPGRLDRTATDPWADPGYTPSFASSSSASITAFHQVHAVEQASLVLFRTGLWPAACALWGIDFQPDAWKRARWDNGALHYPQQEPLRLPALARRAESMGTVTGAMVHGYFAVRWVSATYELGGIEDHLMIDGLATRSGGDASWQIRERSNVEPPPPSAPLYGRSLYTPSGALAAVLVDADRGTVRVTDIHTFLDAGTVLQPDLLSGQYQGAVAMGIGFTLLEGFPSDPAAGPGNGSWNLDRYHLALSRDLPLNRMTLDLLPPLEENAPGKGIAEAVLCPIAPAIANAVAHATGKRFYQLPLTPERVKEALATGS